MFLSISNLPRNVKVERLKQIIKEQCYVENIILDDLKDQGKKKKFIMVGFMDKIDASVVLAKMDGYFLDGNKLSVRVAQQQKNKHPESTKSVYESPLAQPSQYQIPIRPPPPMFSSMNAGLPRPPAPPLFPSMAGALRPPAPPLFPSAGNAGLPRPPLFSAAANSGRLPPAPPLIRSAPPLNPVAPQLNPVAPQLKQITPQLNPVTPQLNPVAPPLNPVPPVLKPVAPASKSKTAKKLPRLKFKIAPPTQQQPSTSTSSTPFYANQQPASIKNLLPEKNKPSQGSTIHRNSNEKSETRNVSSQHESKREKSKKSSGQKTEYQNSRCPRSKSKSRSPHRKPRNKSRSPNRKPRSKSRSPHRRPRSKSRSPHRRSRSKSRSPNRGRSFFGRVDDRCNRYNRDRFGSRFRGHDRFEHGRYSPDHKRDRKRTRYDGRERDSRRSRSHNSERLDKRRRTESPKSDNDDRIALNRERGRRRSRSYDSDREDKRERTGSPISPVRETVTTEETVAPIIPQMNLKPADPNTNLLNNEPTVSLSNNENNYNNPNYYNHVDPHSATFSVHNPYIAGDGSVPTNTYYQTPIWYPPNFSTTQPIYEGSTNPLHRTDPYFQVGFVPLSQNMISSNQNVPMNSSFQAGFIPPPQNVTIHNPNVSINPNFQTRFVSPSQNNNAPTQAGFIQQPQNMITFNKNVPSSAPTQAGFVPQPQNMTMFNKNVPSSALPQARFVPQPQNMTTFDKNVPSSAPTQAGFVPQLQNMTTFNKNVPSSALPQARFVPQPQNMTTFNRNIPSCMPTQAGFVPQPQNTFNESVPKVRNQEVPRKLAKIVSARVVRELLCLYTVEFLPKPVYAQIKQIYLKRIQAIPAIEEKLNIEEAHEYYKSLYPYSNEKLVLESVLGTKVTMLDEVQPNRENNRKCVNKCFNSIKANVVTQAMETSPPVPEQFLESDEPKYEIELNGVDRDQIYEAALDKELQALELTFMNTCQRSSDPDIDIVGKMLKQKGVHDFFEKFKIQILKDVYGKMAFVLKITYEAEISDQNLDEFMKKNNLETLKHNKTAKFITARCKDSKYFYKMLTMKTVQICGETLQIQRQNTIKNEPLFANIESMPNMPKSKNMATNNNITEGFVDINKQVLNIHTEDIKKSSNTQVSEFDTPKDEEHVNTVPTEANQENKQCIDESEKYNVECDTSMKEYVDLSSAEQENIPCIEESSNPYIIKCDKSMEEYINLSSSKLEQENTQCTKESNTQNTESEKTVEGLVNTLLVEAKQENKTQIAERDKPMRQYVDTFTNEVEQENTQCVVESNNAQNRHETRVGEFINIPRAELKPESTQSIEEHNNTHLTRYDKPVEKFVDTLSFEVEQKNAQEQSNKTQECDTPMEELVNVPAAELESEITIEESNKKQNAKCDTLMQQNVNMPPAELKPENIQCTEEFNNTQNAECDSPIVHVKALPAELELENTKCIKESNKIHNAECDIPMEEYVNVQPVDSDLRSTQCTEESKTHNNESDKPVEELVNTFLVEVKEEKKQCVKESNKIQIAEYVTSVEEYVNVRPTELETESIRCIEESISKQKAESDTHLRQYVKEPPADSGLKSTQCTEEFNTHNTESEKPVEELVNTLPVVKQENTQCVKESNKTQITECVTFMEEYVKLRPTELETESIPSFEESISQNAESDTHIREYVKVLPAELEPESTQCIELLNSTENIECIDQSNYTQNTECDTSMDDEIASTLAEIELCLQNSNFDFDNLSNNFNEIDDTYDVKSEMIKTDVVIEEKLDATLATEVNDDDLEDF